MKPPLEAILIRIWHRFVFALGRAERDRELDEELETHRLFKEEDLRRGGLGASSAAYTSRKEMGNMTLHKEECRNMWTLVALERFVQDLRYAARIFRRTPIFTAVAVGSLALGIGGNAAMFSLVNALLLRPLPYSAPERLVRVTGIYPRAAVPFFQQRSRSIDLAAVSIGSEMNLTGEGTAVRVIVSSVSCNFLALLGTPVAKGRAFVRGEDVPGRDAIALISDSFWKEKFGADPAIVGRIITLNGTNRQIAGVMGSRFSYPSARVQVWIPMRLDPSNFVEYWGSEFVPFIGRLRPGASFPEAQGEARRLTAEFRKTFPYPMARDWNSDASVVPLQRDIIGDVRGKLIILLAAVGMVLLIACANVASLLLSRASTRRKEIALRASLGASRLRVIRQLLTEGAGLALVGTASGIVLANGALSIFKSVLPASLPGLVQANIDWQALVMVTVLAVLTGLCFGLAPALSLSQIDLTEVIKTGSQRSTAGFWTRFRSALVVAEVALTLVLTVTAGLLLKSLFALSHASPGLEPDHVLTIRISPDQSFCARRSACVALYNHLTDRASGIAGVRAVAISNSVPLDGELPAIPIDVEGHPKTVEHPAPMVWLGAVTPDYFPMLHIRLVAGRYFTHRDGISSERVAVISAATARRFWPRENAVGKRIKWTGTNDWRTVLGIVADTRQYTLSKALPAWFAGQMYVPYAQAEIEDGQIPAAMTLLVKPGSDSAKLRNELEQLAENENPNVPVSRVRPLEQIMSGSIADFRATMRVFLSFAATAILLAAIGIYGLMSHWVSQRTYEIGLRVAIGATRERIISMIFAEGLRLSGLGILAGIMAALILTRFLASLLYGVGTTDILTFLTMILLVICVATVATAFPAWRAARIDPARCLSAE